MIRIIPGARETGTKTRFAAPVTGPPAYQDSTSTMDAATLADRQREGGGGPSQRRRAGDVPRWKMFFKRFS